MKTNNNTQHTWQQKLLLKDKKTGEILQSHEWTCIEFEDKNADGFFDAIEKFKQVDQSLANILDAEYDDIFDEVMLERKSYPIYGFVIEANPNDCF